MEYKCPFSDSFLEATAYLCALFIQLCAVTSACISVISQMSLCMGLCSHPRYKLNVGVHIYCTDIGTRSDVTADNQMNRVFQLKGNFWTNKGNCISAVIFFKNIKTHQHKFCSSCVWCQSCFPTLYFVKYLFKHFHLNLQQSAGQL